MAEEMKRLTKVCIWVTTSLTYTYYISSRIPSGKLRLLSLLPVLYLLLYLPLTFSTVHLRGISSFFLSWLTVFKLLLFSFGQGPLSSSLPLLTFLSTASLPVNLKPPNHHHPPSRQLPLLGSTLKALLLALLIPLYSHKHTLHPHLLHALYCCHMYLALDLLLASSAALAWSLLGVELEPQFKSPYLSSSLQDFWGRRWNLMVTGILRPTVYAPVRARWGPLVGFMAVFVVSGIMHELMFYYLTLSGPTGEVACFFVLHGVCTVGELVVKRAVTVRWRLHPVVSVPITVGFVVVTGFWLFLPPILRRGTDEKGLAECEAVMRFFLDRWRDLSGRLLKM